DAHPVTVRAYADLQERLDGALIVPVFNEPAIKARNLRDKFPFRRAAEVPLQIPALAPRLKVQIERQPSSFLEAHDTLPMSMPVGAGLELQAWTRRAFLEFRELELRLLLDKLRASLSGVAL